MSPPNAAKTVLLVTRLHALRLWNRLGSRMGRRLVLSGAAGVLFAVFFGGAMMFNTASQASFLVRSLARHEAPGGVSRQSHGLLRPVGIWKLPRESERLAAQLAEVLLLMAACRLCMGVSSAYQDLGKVEGSLEWLFTLPVSARALCLAQILAYTVVDPLGWIVGFPFLLVVFASAGFATGAAVATAAAASLYLGLVLGCCQSAVETLLRKAFSPAKLKNLQAIFSLAGFFLFFLLILVARPDSGLIGLLQRQALPAAMAWSPFSVPLLFCLNVPAWLAAAAVCAYGAAFVLLAVFFFERMVRNGLLATSAVYEGKRGRPGDAKAQARGFLFRGILGKDLRLLMRDRNFLVQTLVLPLVVVACQIFFNAGIFARAKSDFAQASAMAFGLGAYTLTSSAFAVLAVEGNSLWMLYTFPRPLHRLLMEKTLLWTAVALFYTVSVLAYFACVNPGLTLAAAPEAAMAVAGIAVYSFIASGIGVLATDPLRVQTGQRRYRPQMVYLYMILAGVYGFCWYSRPISIQLGGLVIAGMAARTLWRLVRARTPYLLDPHATRAG